MHTELTREAVDQMRGPAVLEFGATWCGFCKAAQPIIDQARAQHAGVHFAWVEDGKGKPLGRSFRVTLWPTLIFLRDGKEVARVVRPTRIEELEEAFATLT